MVTKPFRFESIWNSHPTFRPLVSNIWTSNHHNLIPAIQQFEVDEQEWNLHTFSNIFQKKNVLLARIGGIQRSINYPTSTFLKHLEQQLISDFNDTLKFEEEFLKLKSCINWLNGGDATLASFNY